MRLNSVGKALNKMETIRLTFQTTWLSNCMNISVPNSTALVYMKEKKEHMRRNILIGNFNVLLTVNDGSSRHKISKK